MLLEQWNCFASNGLLGWEMILRATEISDKQTYIEDSAKSNMKNILIGGSTLVPTLNLEHKKSRLNLWNYNLI